MNIKDILGKRILFFDGGMGTMLQKSGLKGGELPELLNITNKELIEKIHCAYLEAGADIVTSNTFGANPLKLTEAGVSAEILAAEGTALAKKCALKYSTPEKDCRRCRKKRRRSCYNRNDVRYSRSEGGCACRKGKHKPPRFLHDDV